MTNRAIDWMRFQKSLTPDKPFFIYFAPGATHAPHQVAKEWIEKYKGKFDEGWDKLRAETLAKRKALGLVPADTQLAPKPTSIKDWDKLTAEEQKLFAHEMEVFAAFGEQTDYEIGRLVDAIGGMGQLNNTLIFYEIGDNGASAEGTMNGVFNEMTYFNGVHETVSGVLKHYRDLGGPFSYGQYAAGWAVAGDTPFKWTKQVASSYGGTQNPLIVQWPKRITGKGGVRSQFHHVIDIAPTVLEAAGLPEPKIVNGTPQTPIQGVSMVYTFDAPKAKSTQTTQYFEIFGNRGIYSDGWLAGTIHKAPWEAAPREALSADVWELCDTSKDFSLASNLALSNPAKLKEMQELFLKEAIANHVLPIDDRGVERANAAVAGRPDLMKGRTSLTVYEGMKGLSENVFINVKNGSLRITADVELPASKAQGVIIAQAGRFGGWSLYLRDGQPTYTYNYLGLQRYTVSSNQPLGAGKATITLDFAYDGGMGNGGIATLSVNGQSVGEGRIEHTQCCIFSADEGTDDGTPVSEDYEAGEASKFTGKIFNVTIDTKPGKPFDKAQTDEIEQNEELERQSVK
jgi:arylsulfatase A-like enzyme